MQKPIKTGQYKYQSATTRGLIIDREIYFPIKTKQPIGEDDIKLCRRTILVQELHKWYWNGLDWMFLKTDYSGKDLNGRA